MVMMIGCGMVTYLGRRDGQWFMPGIAVMSGYTGRGRVG